MTQSTLGRRAMSMGWKLALVVGFTPGAAWAQDCQEDADCGHGFRCLQTSANTSSVVTGSGGSTQVECGDGICEGGVEDSDSCPADCETISYCAPAECDSNSDCAEGYECGEEVGANSGFTSAGGSTASVCGDDTCDFDENNDNCAEDCPVFRYCQPAETQCNSDADCADGFYCYFEGSENSAVSVSAVDSGTSGTDTATGGDDTATGGEDFGSSGNSDSDAGSGSDGADSGFAPPADDTTSGTTGGDETGVCLVESSDAGSSSGTSGSSDNTASGPTDSSATGADTGSTAGNDNGAGGASTVGGEGSPSSGSDGDTGSNATGSDGGGAGGSDPDAGGGDGDGDDGDDGGCSCAVVGVPASSGFLGALLLGVAAGIRRRRTRS